MEVTEKLRDVMKKVEPWQWGAGIVVIILGIRSYLKNKSSSAAVPEPFGALASSGGGGPFQSGDGGSDTTSTIEPGVSADTVNAALDNQANAFSAAFNNAIGGLQNSIVTQNQVIDKVNANFVTLQDKVAQGQITPQANNAVLSPVTSMSSGSSTRSAVAEAPAQVVSNAVSSGNYYTSSAVLPSLGGSSSSVVVSTNQSTGVSSFAGLTTPGVSGVQQGAPTTAQAQQISNYNAGTVQATTYVPSAADQTVMSKPKAGLLPWLK